MYDFPTFDEQATRKHLRAMYQILVKRSFGDGTEFEHMFMSAGTGLAASLDPLGAIERKGSFIILIKPVEAILEGLYRIPVSQLPAVSDVLDVLLTFLGQYDHLPQLTRPDRYADFDGEVAKVLREMGLLDHQSVPQPSLLPVLISHYILNKTDEGWDSRVEDLLADLSDQAWQSAPRDFSDALLGRSGRPQTWCEGNLRRRWRYGEWLTDKQANDRFGYSHSGLASLMCQRMKARLNRMN
jgi:hypothetical protein